MNRKRVIEYITNFYDDASNLKIKREQYKGQKKSHQI